MPLIAATNIKYTIGTRVLLDGVGISLEAGERIGLVGRNGCGKTTLLKILSGRLKPDSGIVGVAKGVRVGYLTQDPELDPSRTLLQEAGAGLTELAGVHTELDQVYHEMALPENASGEKLQRLMDRQTELQHRIDQMGGYAIDHKVEAVLHGLGFTDGQFHIPVSKLSGGQKGRLALAKLLLEAPDLLLLDEPTNHLDIAGREWLEEFLVEEFRGAVIMISHDRYVLDRVVHSIEEIERGRLIEYPGNYSAFVEIRKLRLLTQSREYDNQQSQWAKEEEYIRRFKAGQRAKEAQGRLSKLERQKELFAVERPVENAAMRFNFPQGPRAADHVITLRDACKAYVNPQAQHDVDGEGIEATESSPSDASTPRKVLFDNFNVTISRGERWGIVGPNGAGKTTIVKAMLGQIPLDSGMSKVGSNVFVGYYAQLPPDEDGELPVYQYLQLIIRRENPGSTLSEQSARDLAGAFLFGGQDQDKLLKVMSGGERSRARLAGLLASAKNLIVLDEPTNHLDISSAERLEMALRQSEDGDGFNGTLLLISHDRALIDATCDHLIVLDGKGGASVFHGNYAQWHEHHLQQGKLAQASAQSKAAQSKSQNAKPASSQSQPTKSKSSRDTEESRDSAPAKGQSDKSRAVVMNGAPASASASAPANRNGPKPTASSSKGQTTASGKSGGKTGLSWMPSDRLEKEIEKASAALKQADADLEKEEIYRDAEKCRQALSSRDRLQEELQRLEEEWLRRAE